ncbi:MAG: class I SAM-dependent methyltransferase, partial [Nocardioides sp.]
ALAWNTRDARIPWVRKLWQVLGDQPQLRQATDGSVDALVQSDLFGFVDEAEFHFWQDVDRETIIDLAASRSYVATLDEESRAAKLAEVHAFYEDYGRGMDGMRVPYDCRCYRARVVDRLDDPSPERADPADDATDPPGAESDRRVSDGTDTDMLLIDFR